MYLSYLKGFGSLVVKGACSDYFDFWVINVKFSPAVVQICVHCG